MLRHVTAVSAPPPNSGVFTRERVLALALIFATTLALYVCYRIIEPFIPPIAFALALVVATQGPYHWLRRKLHSPSWTAGVAVILVLLLIIGPAIYLGTYLVQNAIHSINELRSANENWRSIVEGQPVLANVLHWVEANLDLEAHLTQAGEGIAAHATGFLKGSASILTQLGITLFVLFFMYRDCDSGLEALYRLVPLSRNESHRMFRHVAQTLRATVNGSLTVGAVQALLAGTMYASLGVPGAVLWSAATFFAALVPVFGTALIWGPIALYLALIGSWGKALILLAWGCIAIAMIDNFLYPFLVGGKLRLHTVPTFFSIVGGVTLFGASGLILGPMTLAITIGLIDVWWRRTSEGQGAEEEVVQGTEEELPPTPMLHPEST
jgi:predicted PurR-regulated permease PerM